MEVGPDAYGAGEMSKGLLILAAAGALSLGACASYCDYYGCYYPNYQSAVYYPYNNYYGPYYGPGYYGPLYYGQYFNHGYYAHRYRWDGHYWWDGHGYYWDGHVWRDRYGHVRQAPAPR
jgi:hypothetical protein